MADNAGVVQFERRALRIMGSPASPNGTVNTNVLVFNAAAAPIQMTRSGVPGTTTYPIGTTLVAPVANSGTWINAVNSTSAGSQFKFCRRGVYDVQIAANDATAVTALAQIGITLDQAAALDTVAAGTVAALSDTVLAWANGDFLADSSMPILVHTPVYITDFLAGGAQPSADGTTTRGVGVLRFIVNDQANGEIADATLVVGLIRATIYSQNEING